MDVPNPRFVEPSAAERIGVSKREHPKIRVARTRKPGDVAGCIQTIAGKCDSLFIMRQEEAGCDFAVWPSEVVDIGCELVFIEMAGFCEN